MVLAITFGALFLLSLGYLAWPALTWVLIAAFLAMALNPVVELFERRGLPRGIMVYQQVENHAIQPLIYGRAVNLSPLGVLVAVLVGAELGGILGAIAAIPVGGSISVIATELLHWRRESMIEAPAGVDLDHASPPAEQPDD